MAIAKSHSFKGLVLNAAYHRIDWMNLNMMNSVPTLEVRVGTYVSPEQAEFADNAVESRSFVLAVEKSNVSLRSCYVALSALPEFSVGSEV
jgi:hypothetical protein